MPWNYYLETGVASSHGEAVYATLPLKNLDCAFVLFGNIDDYRGGIFRGIGPALGLFYPCYSECGILETILALSSR